LQDRRATPGRRFPVIVITSFLGAGRSAGLGATPDFHHGLLALDLKFIPSGVHAQLGNQVSDVRRMLTRFIQTLN
jgi:hypothetical protein